MKLTLKQRAQSCVCCKAHRIDDKHFRLADGTKSIITRDHITLRSLGGSDTNFMCERCNTLRGNLFAEQSEFIAWFHSGEPKPERNFSYVKVRPQIKTVELPSLNLSVVIHEVNLKDGVYLEYTHPLFGKSLVKKQLTS